MRRTTITLALFAGQLPTAIRAGQLDGEDFMLRKGVRRFMQPGDFRPS